MCVRQRETNIDVTERSALSYRLRERDDDFGQSARLFLIISGRIETNRYCQLGRRKKKTTHRKLLIGCCYKKFKLKWKLAKLSYLHLELRSTEQTFFKSVDNQ